MLGIAAPSLGKWGRIADYAGITFDKNAGALSIGLVDAYYLVTDWDTNQPEVKSVGDHANNKITIGATAVYSVFINIHSTPAGTNKTFTIDVFEIAATGATVTGVSEATPAIVTAADHGFATDDRIEFTGIVGMVELNDRIFKITKLTDDTFSLRDDEGVDLASGGFTTWASGGTQRAKLATFITVAQAHRKHATQDLGSSAGSGLASLTKNNVIRVYAKNFGDTTNITLEYGSCWVDRKRV